MSRPERPLSAPLVPAGDRPHWTFRENDLWAWGVWTEKLPDRGEDAEPLWEHHRSSGSGIIGVFDGAGGAGNAAADPDRFGNRATSAWVASRVAALATREWFHSLVTSPGGTPGSEIEVLEDGIASALKLMRPRERSRITGSMVRPMPTTMAAATYRPSGDQITVRALWAGDSRVYVLQPDWGLCVLTRDHTEEQDTLRQLRQDPPMENMLSASSQLRVEVMKETFKPPFLLLCATDGYFGYVDAPHRFEQVLLESLRDAERAEDLPTELERRVRTYTGDDATLSMVAFGFEDFPSLQGSFDTRLRKLQGLYPSPPTTGQEDFHRWQEECWEHYRVMYEDLIPPIEKGTT